MARTRVRNLDKLERKLKAIPKEVSAAMREAYEKNGDELVAMMKAICAIQSNGNTATATIAGLA